MARRDRQPVPPASTQGAPETRAGDPSAPVVDATTDTSRPVALTRVTLVVGQYVMGQTRTRIDASEDVRLTRLPDGAVEVRTRAGAVELLGPACVGAMAVRTELEGRCPAGRDRS